MDEGRYVYHCLLVFDQINNYGKCQKKNGSKVSSQCTCNLNTCICLSISNFLAHMTQRPLGRGGCGLCVSSSNNQPVYSNDNQVGL